MPRLIDQAAKEIAVSKFALPECLHIPIAAVGEAAIRDYIGDPIRTIGRGMPSKALVVSVSDQPEIDQSLPIWQISSSSILRSST
jgi:hypothetical protein